MNDPKRNIKFVCFDLETNGCPQSGSIFNPFHRIVQISAVHGEEQFDKVVNPECHVPSESTAIHHLTNQRVVAARTFKNVFPLFRAFVKRGATRDTQIVLVAHNALGFDKILLEKECIRCGMKLPPEWRFYDTLQTYRRDFATLPSKKLGDVYQNRFGEPITNAHNALSDTIALQRLFYHEIQTKFNMDHTISASASASYTSSDAPVQQLRGIGLYTKRAIVNMIGKTSPTVGDLRVYCAGKSFQDIELILRVKLRCTRETFLFSLLCEMTTHANPYNLFAAFPFAIHAFPGLSDASVEKLLAMGICSPEQLKRHYLYVLQESGEAWDLLMDTLECESFRVGLLLRSI